MSQWKTPAPQVCHKCHTTIKHKIMTNLGDDWGQPIDWVCCKKCDPNADENKVLFHIHLSINGSKESIERFDTTGE